MDSGTPSRRRLTNGVKQALRSASLQLALLNHQVGGKLKLRDVDFDCLNLLNQHGQLSPSALAKLAGLHPATMTGVLDRLEKAGWVIRERDAVDRRAVVLRSQRERGGEVLALFGDMNGAMDEICENYTTEQLEVIADFLGRTATAGHEATEKLAG